ncbi:hypothetical protein O3M35_004452 [Rhynocoris fuscipes]|uniref:Uncharacterized protein n=1 Tax=Rhynocoris fuscipes TaxID=488301 RepID=A0AAW1CJX8_9HEMI
MEILFLLLLGVIGEAHIIIKEPARYQVSRLAYNDWRPLKQNNGPILRYPVYKKIYGPLKKEIYDQNVDGSEQILQQFSPAPPSILGSLNVFGHATVKARQNGKPTRPLIDTRTYYQNQHKHIAPYLIYKDPPKRSSTQTTNSYKRQPIYTSDDRAPISHYQQAQSTSLASNTYYFDQQPAFVPSIRDHSYEKLRKPSTTDSSYNLPYTIPTFDYHGLTFYNTNNYQDLYRNPYSDIHLNDGKREQLNDSPNGNIAAPNGSPNDPLYESSISLGKPFHHSGNHQSTTKTKGSYSTPLVTTSYSTLSSPTPPHQPSKLSTIKFSQVAQPFQLATSKPKFENDYTETVYPLSVTTVDVPEPIGGNNNGFVPSFPKFQSNFYNNTQLQNTNENLNTKTPSFSSEQPFLPTPATENTWLNQKDVDELTTMGQQLYAETTMNGNEEDGGTWATVITTIAAPVETTTIKKHKSRRRPNRRPPAKSTSERVTEESVTTVDYNKYNRRRKPINKLYTNSDLKRLRSTTTTTSTTAATTLPQFIDIIEETTTLPNITTSVIDYITEPIQFTSEINQQNEQQQQQQQNTKDTLNTDEETTQIPEILHNISTTSRTTTTTTEPTTTPATNLTTSSATSLSVKMRMKYGNRPRFSVKDYRERLRTTTTTTSAPQTNEYQRNRSDSNKTKFRNTSTKPDKDDTEISTEPKYKFKPRVTASRYKFSTTTAINSETTTTERVNSFKPSSNRYKSNGGKYYSRYRSSTASSIEADDEGFTTAASTRLTIKPKGVYSAKRRPLPNRPKSDEAITSIQQTPTEILKIKDNEVIPSSPTRNLEEIDNNNSELLANANKNEENIDPTGEEATKVADLTSSSTNQFHQTATMTKFQRRRPTQKISLPRDDPILPLEAFFQTQTKDS